MAREPTPTGGGSGDHHAMIAVLKRLWASYWIPLLLLPFYLERLVYAAAGQEWERRFLHPTVFLLWIPMLVAWRLEYQGGGFLPAPLRPDRPDGRAAVVGFAYAMGAAGCMLGLPSLGPSAAPLRASDLEFALLFFVVATPLFVATIPRPANWVRAWNADQAQRLLDAERALASARTNVLQSQMQPHFLFNALNSVTALLREDPARAKSVLRSLRGLMERSLATAHQPTTTVRDEVAFVRDQLAIEHERFHDRLTVHFDVDERLLGTTIPTFSLQPLAENALRHGIAQSIDGGRVDLLVAREGRDVILEVRNTGAGLPSRWREGMGLSNLRQRLQSAYGPRASLSIEQCGDHTLARIRIAPKVIRSAKP
jgi:two-component sensor histidine kinase